MNNPAIDALTRSAHPAGPLALRPLTLGSYSLCCRAGLRLVLGPALDPEGKPTPLPAADQPYEVAAFAYIHSAPLPAVLDALDAPDSARAFRRAVDEWAMSLTVADFATLARIIPEMIRAAFSALVVPAGTTEKSTDDFASKNGRGRRG